MRWWQISNTPLHQQSWTQPQWKESAAPIGLGNKTKQKKETRPGSEVSISCPRLFACHLLDMIITTEQGCRGLSRPHLHQQAGIKLSNYPPRPPAWAPSSPSLELVPFASLACSQTLQAGMWTHILMTALFQSQVFVIALGSLYTLCGTSPK